MNRLTSRLAVVAMVTVVALLIFNFVVMPTDMTESKSHLKKDHLADCQCELTNGAETHEHRHHNFDNVKLDVVPIAVPSGDVLQLKAGSIRDGFVSFQPDTAELTFRLNPNFQPSSCPTSLQKKVLESSWFAARYRPDIPLIAHKNKFSQSEYDRLMPYWMPFGYKYHQNVTFEEIQTVYEEFQIEDGIFATPKDGKKASCVSCAVIGTGGILNGSHMGREIDSHDMVFRVNNALRRGHEVDVGTKLTHYVFFDRSLLYTDKSDLPNDEGVTYLFIPCRKQDYGYILDVIGKGKSKRPPKIRTKSDNIRILHPDFVRYIHKIWENTTSFRPTTGALMVMTALHGGCDMVSLYGMGFTHDYSMHYYDKEYVRYPNLKGSHDFKREIALWRQLHRDGIVRWYKRDVAEFS